LPRVVELDGDLGVPLDAGHGIDDDARHLLSPDLTTETPRTQRRRGPTGSAFCLLCVLGVSVVIDCCATNTAFGERRGLPHRSKHLLPAATFCQYISTVARCTGRRPAWMHPFCLSSTNCPWPRPPGCSGTLSCRSRPCRPFTTPTAAIPTSAA